MKPGAFLSPLARRAAPALIAATAITMSAPLAHADAAPQNAPEVSVADSPTAVTDSSQTPSGQETDTPIAIGVFGQNAHRTQQFESAIGHRVQVLTVFPAREKGWESIMDPWWLNTAPPGYTGTLDVGVPLFPTGSNLDEAASGAYDDRWEELGRLIAAKHPDAYVRIGWEHNIINWEWKATEGTAEQSKQAFRRAATALKRGGPQLRTQWVINSGVGNSLADATKIYPGDDVVDVIGIDAYGWKDGDPIDGPGGITQWIQFTREHGKKFALPEWGVHAGEDGAGDNPELIARVMGTLKANADIVAYASYFDEPESYIRNSIATGQAPRAAAELRSQLG